MIDSNYGDYPNRRRTPDTTDKNNQDPIPCGGVYPPPYLGGAGEGRTLITPRFVYSGDIHGTGLPGKPTPPPVERADDDKESFSMADNSEGKESKPRSEMDWLVLLPVAFILCMMFVVPISNYGWPPFIDPPRGAALDVPALVASRTPAPIVPAAQAIAATPTAALLRLDFQGRVWACQCQPVTASPTPRASPTRRPTSTPRRPTATPTSGAYPPWELPTQPAYP